MIRKMSMSDCAKSITDLIIATDDYIYPPMFAKNEAEAYPFFERCFKEPNSVFYYKNISVLVVSEQIVAICVNLIYNEKTVLAGFDYSSFSCKDEIEYAERHYFDVLKAEYVHQNSVVYINNLCVLHTMRGNGHGKALLADVLKQAKTATVELDVLCDNPNAIALYESCGFSVVSKDPAFAFEEKQDFFSYKMRTICLTEN